jgi:putative flavoprotein involved in K+ transport
VNDGRTLRDSRLEVLNRHVSVVVVGAGQAGLAVSRELRVAGIEHVVLERSRIAQAWRDRWDSFTLVTPNWTMDLPGSPYAGDDPEGHVPRDEIVGYLEGYATGDVREGVTVTAVRPGQNARLHLETSDGPMDARAVVVCTGAYQKPHRPAAAARFPNSVTVIDATAYRNPDQLPPGRVLVVGSGQTGVQLAEELHLAGRDPLLACGRAPWAPRQIAGRDVITVLSEAGFYDQTRSTLPSPEARLIANVQATGARGGHDLHFRVLQGLGVELTGRLDRVSDGLVRFADDLAESIAFGDARYEDMRRFVRDRLGSVADHLSDPEPFRCPPTATLAVAELGAVVFTSGFRPDYRGWVQLPVFDDLGFPIVKDDLTTAVPGLYFCGVHFLRTRRSSLLFGVGQDAALVAAAVRSAVD